MKNLTRYIGIGSIGLLSVLGVWKAGELVSQRFRQQEPEYVLHVTRMPQKYGRELAIRLENREGSIYDTSGGLYSYDPKVKIISEDAEQFVRSGMK